MGKNLNSISKDARLGKDIRVEEFVVLQGNCKIGDKSLIRSHTVIYPGNIIGKNFKAGHGVLIRENNIIGNNVSIGSHSIIEHDVIIEDNCRIHSNAFIPELTVLGEGCWIGPSVVLTNAKYPNSPATKRKLVGVKVGKNAKIGAGAIILPGVKIGKNSFVGAGAVVTGDVVNDVVVVGNPAKVINRVSSIGDYGKDKKV
jgi:acetyltransferase-like isoleucine patch superfamily enzyme